MYAFAAELAEMRNKIRLLQADATATSLPAAPVAAPLDARVDNPSDPTSRPVEEQQQPAPLQRRKAKWVLFPCLQFQTLRTGHSRQARLQTKAMSCIETDLLACLWVVFCPVQQDKIA